MQEPEWGVIQNLEGREIKYPDMKKQQQKPLSKGRLIDPINWIAKEKMCQSIWMELFSRQGETNTGAQAGVGKGRPETVPCWLALHW